MKFKLDENLGTRTQQVFRAAGHQVHTVRDQALGGTSDQQLYDVCCAEGFCLVSLDLDFGDVLRFPPAASKGIAVIRVPQNPSLALLEALVRQFLLALENQSIEKKLWIVETGRIRIHSSRDDEV